MCRLLKYVGLCLILLFVAPVQARVNIALVAPKAGDYQEQGEELIKGAKRAVDEINQNGGLLGKKVNLLTVDDQCNNSIAISTAQMLAIQKENKINLVIGPYCANSFDQVADVYAKAQIFQIIPTTVNYTQAKTIKKGLVKMLGYTNQQARDFFNFYNQTMAGQYVAVISNQNDIESMDEANAIIQEFSKHGKSSLIKLYTYDMTDKDYDSLARKIFKEGYQMAFLLGSAKNIRKMARALKEDREEFILFTNRYSATKEYFDYLGNLAEGTYLMELRGRNDDPDFAETLVKLRLSGFETNGLSLYGYSAVKLWESLAKKAGSFDYNKLSAVTNDKNIRTEFGNRMFHNGAPKVSESYAIYRYADEDFEKVY
ncbi:MAG: amino acid ABC transporter substrate-binding protein [Alphaproteobacteria bacterium]|nr:amino acid ABC transporter substrate-binding protein [Alphaproteobacteria bacterium]